MANEPLNSELDKKQPTTSAERPAAPKTAPASAASAAPTGGRRDGKPAAETPQAPARPKDSADKAAPRPADPARAASRPADPARATSRPADPARATSAAPKSSGGASAPAGRAGQGAGGNRPSTPAPARGSGAPAAKGAAPVKGPPQAAPARPNQARPEGRNSGIPSATMPGRNSSPTPGASGAAQPPRPGNASQPPRPGGNQQQPAPMGGNRPAPARQQQPSQAPARQQQPSQAPSQAPAQRSGGSNQTSNGKRPQQSNAHPKHAHGGAAAKDREAAALPRPAARAESAVPAVTEIIIPAHITVRELAEKMRRSPIEIIKTLMNYGIMVPITQTIDFNTAVVVGDELGVAVLPVPAPEPEVKPEPEAAPKTLRQKILAEEKAEQLVIRPPIVTVLGHVDHGKTTLLDAIRETRVVDGEAGGITQHIGAYQVECKGRMITFLDTPGHAAFTAMRARGAQVTDIAVLVVAADDGVMPQTKEAIAHVRAAQVPIVVALNKIDKPNANPDRVKQELADNGLLIEEYGGDVICVPVSAKMRRGIDDLLENILLVADIDPLLANPGGECKGSVIESRLDKTRGPLATMLVQNGTLHPGDSVVVGTTYGKLRALYDDKGHPITAAPPAMPTVVFGLSEVPSAGDVFEVVEDERTARAIAHERIERKRAATAAAAAAVAPKVMTLENIFAAAEAGQVKELTLILKADVVGSIEPIVSSLTKLDDEKMHVKILHQATGNISEGDVMLALASRAIILGFNVNVDSTAQRMAEAEGVEVRLYNIIYNLIEAVQKALIGLLEPVFREVILGHAEVRAVFRVTKVGKVAGCMVTDGELVRNSMARVKRAGQMLREDKIVSLKRFQEDTSEVKTGFECGLNFGNFNDFEVGDIIEVYKKERVS